VAAVAHAADRPDNFVQWREGLASAAQPDSAWLARAKDLGYDVVVNLAPPQVHGSIANEGGIVGAKGVTYVNIPVDFRHPTAEDFRFFSAVLKANAKRNVFVHCQVNLRGSSFVFLYRVIHEGTPVNEAMTKLYGVWSPDAVWKKFIEETLEGSGRKAELM
jgi:protein tyrosine phosphatase (PTP) superfamily phosphohydrolase (DUF442 family)